MNARSSGNQCKKRFKCSTFSAIDNRLRPQTLTSTCARAPCATGAFAPNVELAAGEVTQRLPTPSCEITSTRARANGNGDGALVPLLTTLLILPAAAATVKGLGRCWGTIGFWAAGVELSEGEVARRFPARSREGSCVCASANGNRDGTVIVAATLLTLFATVATTKGLGWGRGTSGEFEADDELASRKLEQRPPTPSCEGSSNRADTHGRGESSFASSVTTFPAFLADVAAANNLELGWGFIAKRHSKHLDNELIWTKH